MIITAIFPLSDREVLVVHLASFDWDFRPGRPVRLVQGKDAIAATQTGSGNHEGHATLTLAPQGDWDGAIQALRAMEASGQPIEIEGVGLAGKSGFASP